MPTVANSRPMLEEQAASLTTDEDFLLEQQQTLSRECAESVLTSNDLTENFLIITCLKWQQTWILRWRKIP